MGNILGGHIARMVDPNSPKGYSIPYNVCLATEAKRKEKDGGICYYDICLLEQLLCVLKPYFLGSGWTSPADGK